MRGLLLSILILSVGAAAIAQENYDKASLRAEADNYYKDEQYNLAIQYYRALVNESDQDAGLNYQLAESYRKTFNYAEAEAYYLKVHYQEPANYPLSLYYYALMLKLNGEFDESINRFSEFIASASAKSDLKEFAEQAAVDQAGSEMARVETSKIQSPVPMKSLTLNTEFNDYAPALKDSVTLVITSGRVASNRKAIDERYGEAFTDNFYFVKSGNQWIDRTRQEFNITNSRYNDGSGCFNSNGTKYYFTVCGKDGPECRIYMSELRNNQWSAPMILNENVNMKNYESRHPAISHGGDTLLFSSNRPGGQGKYDIWMSINAGQGKWGPAVNLGKDINTKMNEFAPAFTPYANVFFLCSDGHQNYGGLDLYMAKRMSNGTVAIYNLDYPFNSNRDDFFIVVGGNKIYFSSNRDGGRGNFDIYAADIPSVISFISKLSLKKKVGRGDVKLNARTERVKSMDLLTARNEDRIEYENLTYEKRKLVDKMVANQLNNIPNRPEDFAQLKPGEFNALKTISDTQVKTQALAKRFVKNFLSRINVNTGSTQDVSVRGVLTDSLTGKILAEHKILLMDDTGEVIKVTTTNEEGRFRFTNVSPYRNLYLRTSELSNEGGSSAHVTGLNVAAMENETAISYENIYFDFDHYRLRDEAKQILDELARYLKASPNVQVEIYAYADDLGSDDYNMVLTERRGQTVLNYLTQKGIDQTALAVIAKGKKKNVQSQAEVQRQLDRRVEFYLNGAPPTVVGSAKTYITRKKTTWEEIGRTTGMPASELRTLNGTSAEEVMLYQPVRLPLRSRSVPQELFFGIH